MVGTKYATKVLSSETGQKVTKTVKKKVKRKIKARFYFFLALLLAIIIGIIALVRYSYFAIFNVVSSANSVISDWIPEAATDFKDVTIPDVKEYPKYGVYPVDYSLRIKQEMMEICEAAGQVYGIPGYMVLGLAMVETSVHERLPAMERSDGSLYTDLCIGYAYVGGDTSKPIFLDGDNKGKYKDKAGNAIVDPLKVGTIDTGAASAIGPFQFYATYIEGSFTRVYVPNGAGKATVREGLTLMGEFDEQLGFMRPNPLYFPDAAMNAAAEIRSHMDQHNGRLSDITSLNLPQSIKDEILFVYAADSYHGDTSAMGDKARAWHDALAKFYGDIYAKYSKESPHISSIGDFSKDEYNRQKIRTLIGGVQFNAVDSSGRNHIDFDGSFDRQSSVISSDGAGKHLELGGYKYYKSLVTSVSNTSPFNTNYRQLLDDMPAITGSGTNNKYSWVYGFEALNTSAYHSKLWNTQISQAEKIGGGLNGEGLPIGATDGSIDPNAYPLGDISIIQWNTGKTADEEIRNLNTVFLGRLAKFAEDKGITIKVTSGYRSVEEQRAAIDSWTGKCEADGTLISSSYDDGVYAWYEGEKVCWAAGQYRSRHRLGYAVDISGFSSITNKMLEPYGLRKPMSYEPWHVEPIETSN